MSNNKTAEQHVPMASAYAIVPREEGEDQVAAAAAAAAELPTVAFATLLHRPSEVDVHKPVTTSSGTGAVMTSTPEFSSHLLLPEAQGLTWNDDFFDEEDGVVAVFDFDYDGMECHAKAWSWGCLGVTSFCFPSCIPFFILGLVPCYINPNVRWNARAQHVAVTRDGIVFCQDKHPTCWGGPNCSVAKRTKTIPFDQISDVVVTDAGDACMCVTSSSPLSIVNIGTPSNRNGDGSHEVSIRGLYNPDAFRKVVLAMKRATAGAAAGGGGGGAFATPATPVAAVSMIQRELGLESRANETTTTSNEQLAILLREIRDELRQSNQAAQVAAAVQGATAPPADTGSSVI